MHQEPEEINADDEVEDTCDNKEDDLGAVEEQRSVILHLLSQLKLGMDLTRVSDHCGDHRVRTTPAIPVSFRLLGLLFFMSQFLSLLMSISYFH